MLDYFEFNKDITRLSSMQLQAYARYFFEPGSIQQTLDTIKFCRDNQIKWKVIGDGSNIHFKPFFDGILIKPKIRCLECIESNKSNEKWKVGAGENWDDTVYFFTNKGLGGLENLSFIPGSVGASPVQNLNAYGVDVSRCIESVECIDLRTFSQVKLSHSDCEFVYRGSTFKYKNAGRYIITSVTFGLSKKFKPSIEYKALEPLTGKNLTPQKVRDFIVNLRKIRLPDVEEFATNGSFFTNTLTDQKTYEYIVNNTSYLKESKFAVNPVDKTSGKYKLITASLINNSGCFDIKNMHFDFFCSSFEKGKHGNIIIHKSLRGSYDDLYDFVEEIRNRVKDTFGVEIAVEPEAI